MAKEVTAHVAVASNFTTVMAALQQQFEAGSAYTLTLSSASTGTLYAQIKNGAPFDVLLAADAQRPALLEAAALSVPGQRRTYAMGRLVLWSRDAALRSKDCEQALRRAATATRAGRIAIANPDIAPYGRAAREALVQLGLWEALRSRLVYGENIAQTLHFVASGNAQLGLIAAAQLQAEQLPATACSWILPADSHAPIEQQAVLLQRGADNPAAVAFFEYLQSAEARDTIAGYGYAAPAAASIR